MPNPSSITSYFGGTITQGYNPPTEYGVDVGLPAGTPVDLPVGGTYRQDLSTPYTAVFALPSGQYEDFVHITPAHFADNQQVASGMQVGVVSPIYNTTAPYSVGTFPNLVSGAPVGPFYSSGPHVEFGLYGNPIDAMNASGTSSVDPSQLFTQPSTGAYQPPASSGTIPSPTQPDQGTVGSPTGPNIQLPNVQLPSIPNPFQSINDLVHSIPKDIGQRIAFLLIAVALIIVGGLIIGANSGVLKAIRP